LHALPKNLVTQLVVVTAMPVVSMVTMMFPVFLVVLVASVSGSCLRTKRCGAE